MSPQDNSSMMISVKSFESNIYILSLINHPENRLNSTICKEITKALHFVQREIGANAPGALITTSDIQKFFSNGIDLEESKSDPWASTDGYYPMLAAILDFPYPTVACIPGHLYGGACLFALAHDYRVMNSQKGFICMPAMDLGVHFRGMGILPRLKLLPQVARKMMLEGHRWTGETAYKDGIIDLLACPEQIFATALEIARKWAPKAQMGVYGVLRDELYGEAATTLRSMSYVRSRDTAERPKFKI